MPSFQGLPQELSIYIFSCCIAGMHCPYQQVAFLERTCKSFNTAIRSSSLWHTAYKSSFDDSINKSPLTSIDWKDRYKQKIVFLDTVRSRLATIPLDNVDAFHQCGDIMNKLWEMVHANNGRNTKYFYRYAIKSAVAQFFLRASSSDIPEQFRLVQGEFHQHAVPLRQGFKVLAMLLAIEGVDVGLFVDDRIDDFMTDISYYYDFTEEYVTFVCACRIFISILWTVSLSARAFPDQNIPQPLPLHPRASVFVDRTQDKAPETEEVICKPYVEYSGKWYGYDTYMDMAGNEDIDQHMDMELQFVTSEDEATEMTLGGSGSDAIGDFEIGNGVWKANGCVQFCKRYIDRENTLIRYMGRTLPSGVCGVYNSEGPELMLNGTFFLWRAERQSTLYD